MKIARILMITRWLYSAFFLLIGAQALLASAGILQASEFPGSPETKAFTNAIFATGFIGPIMSVTYVASGILMLFNRTAPLGIVLLTPFVVVILFTHLMLNGSPVFGILLASLLGLFAWQFREAYQPMWNYRNESKMKE